MGTIFWGENISQEEVQKILKDENHPRFLKLTAELLLKTSDPPKKIFADYLDKMIFLQNWKKIKVQMSKDKWGDRSTKFWNEIYRVLRKDMASELKKIERKKEFSVIPAASEEKIGCLIKKIRYEMKMSQKELAQKSSLSQQTISALENDRLNFTLGTLTKVLGVLNYDIYLKSKEIISNNSGASNEFKIQLGGDSATGDFKSFKTDDLKFG